MELKELKCKNCGANLKVEQKYYPHIYKPNLTLERTSREIENNPYENQLSQFLKH